LSTKEDNTKNKIKISISKVYVMNEGRLSCVVLINHTQGAQERKRSVEIR